jgi:hypothetical protein
LKYGDVGLATYAASLRRLAVASVERPPNPKFASPSFAAVVAHFYSPREVSVVSVLKMIGFLS